MLCTGLELSPAAANSNSAAAASRFIAGKVRPLGLGLLEDKVQEVFQDSKVDTEALLSYQVVLLTSPAPVPPQDRVLLASVKEIRESLTIPADFWRYVTDSVLFSQMDMTLVQVRPRVKATLRFHKTVQCSRVLSLASSFSFPSTMGLHG